MLVKLGDEDWGAGTKQTFVIGDHERLIGCELEYGNSILQGVTFLKWTLY